MPREIIEQLGSAGPVIAILIVLSLLSVLLIFAKTFQLWPVTGGGTRRARALDQWSAGDKTTAYATMREARSPADRIAAFAMRATNEGLSRPVLISELERRGNAEVEQMGRHIRLLELIAMVAPLLGLLGTVLGMIQSFQELELAQGAANAATLAGGIWQALLTTAAGLIVAIPAAVGAALLSARVDRAAAGIEDTIGQFLLADEGY